jgi:dihydroxy-acid dehydratase
MEDVHRAGGIPALLGELNRGGLLHKDVHSVHSAELDGWLETGTSAAARPPTEAGPVARRSRRRPLLHCVLPVEPWTSLDTDAPKTAASAAVEHAYSKDGGLAVLRGNVAVDGAVVKTAGVDESIWTSSKARAVVCESRTKPWKRS